MAEYNNQSIDIDLEDMFNNLSDEDQEEFLVDMFRNLPGEEERADVVKDNVYERIPTYTNVYERIRMYT